MEQQLTMSAVKITSIDSWFSSRGLRMLEYQKDIIENKIPNSFSTNTLPTVLAACPSAGKTIMSIAFIDKFIKENPASRVLVLTHGTTVLRSQYAEEVGKLKPEFTWSNIEGKKDLENNTSQVFIALPQTLKRAILPQFDLIVIDEAHHFYFADMVQRIIKKAKHKYQLLLTGTPSPFIRKSYPIIPVTVNQLLDYDMVEDIIVELASSTYNFNQKDYNNLFELKDDVTINETETISTLDLLLKSVTKRLKSVFKNDSVKYANVGHITGWKLALMSLSKTMIACKSQHQAKQVARYFQSKGIGVALSISDTDIDSEEMGRFKTDKDCLILIVVARGILGFNFPEMENVIDMTASQNIDRIFQLMARVLRKHPNGKKKLFFKIASHYLEEYFEFIMTCVLCLTDENYYTKFNGKNFLDLEIPVVRLKKEKKTSDSGSGTGSEANKNKREIKSIDYMGIPSIRFFKDILHNNHDILSGYAFVNIRDIRTFVLLDKKSNGFWTLKKCQEDSIQYSSRQEWKDKSPQCFHTAYKNGWADECTKHMEMKNKPSGYWTKEVVLKEAKKYKTIDEWSKKSSASYTKAKEAKWMEECTKHMIELKKPSNFWTLETCKEDALKYNSKKEWRKNSSGGYGIAYNSGWMEECTKHMKELIRPRNFFTLEKCKEEAFKCSTKKEWREKFPSSYTIAFDKGWFNECSAHMINLHKSWTKEMCLTDSTLCSSKKEWKNKFPNSYSAAQRNNWIDECSTNMKKK